MLPYYVESRTKETIWFPESVLPSPFSPHFLLFSSLLKIILSATSGKANWESEAEPSSGGQICSGSLFHPDTNFSNNVITRRTGQISRACKFLHVRFNYLSRSDGLADFREMRMWSERGEFKIKTKGGEGRGKKRKKKKKKGRKKGATRNLSFAQRGAGILLLKISFRTPFHARWLHKWISASRIPIT